jgi:hypothetical protein
VEDPKSVQPPEIAGSTRFAVQFVGVACAAQIISLDTISRVSVVPIITFKSSVNVKFVGVSPATKLFETAEVQVTLVEPPSLAVPPSVPVPSSVPVPPILTAGSSSSAAETVYPV